MAVASPPLQKLGVAGARAAVRRRALERTAPTPVWRVEQLSVASVRLRVYRPAPGPRPALLYLHGGGTVLGDLDTHDAAAAALAAHSGCTVASVDYRLAPEHPFPAAVEDARTATDWREAAETGPLAVGGDSAGAGLATALCLLLRDDGARLPALQVLRWPLLDWTLATWRDVPGEPMLSKAELGWCRSLCFPDPRLAASERASPLLAADLAGLPRALIASAGHDPLEPQAEAYARRLASAGVDARLVRHPDLPHKFAGFSAVSERAAGAERSLAVAVGGLLLQTP